MNECNPLLLNCKNSELQEYINHNKEIKEKVMEKSLDNKDWECCICLGGYIKEKKYICMPFNCNHDICFSCFSTYVNLQKNTQQIICQKIYIVLYVERNLINIGKIVNALNFNGINLKIIMNMFI